jgi:cathepsin A (carboxypeptidase C)
MFSGQLPAIMKPILPLLSVLLLISSPINVYGAPPRLDSNAQAVFNQRPLGISREEFRDAASEWLDDAKQAILMGKMNMEKWFHDGREYIKQDNLLCEC